MPGRYEWGDLLATWLMVLSAQAEDGFSAWVGLGLAFVIAFNNKRGD